MKLAREIAEDIRSRWILQTRPRINPTLEQVIEERLEPLREALDKANDFIEVSARHGFFCNSRDRKPCDCGLEDAMKKTQAALAMLEDK